ncbi:MAG: helix-turn-helix domain-containing protein [Eubacteriales bacterium]
MEENPKRIDLLELSPYVRYVHCCVDARSTTHQVPWRMIYDYELLFVIKGRMEVVTDGKTVVLSENEIHTVPPLLYHTVRIPEGESCTYYSVHFDFVHLGRENDFSPEEVYISKCNRNLESVPMNEHLKRRPMVEPGEGILPEKLTVDDPAGYTDLLKSMIRIQREKPFAWEIDLKCAMLSLLKRILLDRRRQGTKPPERTMEHFMAITAYLFDHFNEPIDFEKLSRMFGYSYSSFRKKFKEKTGKSPHEYLTDLRLEQAVTLLSSCLYTVSEVAWMVGYEDVSYFSRLFRKRKGRSPSAFIQS